MIPLRLTLAAALLLPTAPHLQQPPLPTIKVDTKLTIVDVTVTDKYGHPVHGLTQSDFTIKEDNHPQPIKNFDEYGNTPPTIPMGPKLPPGVYTNITTAPPAKGTVNILLFNQLDRVEDMLYARAQAEDYLKTMPQGTRVAILVLENGVHLLQNITTDRDLLLATVRSINYHPVSGASWNSGPACVWTNQQSRLAVDAFRQIAASFSTIRGRKNLIWFTHGMPWLTNPGYLRSEGFFCIDDDTQQLQEAYSMLSASQVAISTVDPRGLEAPSIAGGISRSSVAGDFMDRQLNQESIRDFAEKTGGAAYYNRNDLDGAMSESVAANADYYAVSYTPPLAGYDGKYHTIDVKVNRPGLQLTYRKGYTSLDLAKLNTTLERDKNISNRQGSAQQAALPAAVSQFRAEMLHGAVPSSDLLLAASIRPTAAPAKSVPTPVKGNLNPKIKPNPLIRYDVVYFLPPGQITLSEGPDGTRKGAIEFDIVAYAEDGTKLNVIRQTANITLKPGDVAAFNKNSFEVPLQLDLPPGKLFLRVGALDIPSGRSGTLEVPQTVAKPAKP